MKNHDNYDVGVIVGRFQVPDLHEGHKKLIDFVSERHNKIIIVLGLTPEMNSTQNPLDFESRRQMIQEAYPFINVLWIADCGDDDFWSEQLDSLIRFMLTPSQSVLLYGGRDSFLDVYTGSYDTYELHQAHYMSGTEIRNIVRQTCRPSSDFRAGVIWANANRFPTVYTCVDVAIFNEGDTKIGLGRKLHDKAWRLVGGFADVNSPSFEADAYREVREETGIGFTSELEYLGSFLVDDWRYHNEPDQIKTLLFKGNTFDKGKAGDDIEWFQWFDVDDVADNLDKLVIADHQPLVERAIKSVR